MFRHEFQGWIGSGRFFPHSSRTDVGGRAMRAIMDLLHSTAQVELAQSISGTLETVENPIPLDISFDYVGEGDTARDHVLLSREMHVAV